MTIHLFTFIKFIVYLVWYYYESFQSLQALAVTITKFVVEPLEHIGHAVGKLIHGTLQELPIQIWPFAMAFICVMSFFLLILVFGYRIKLFYLFGIEPGKDTPRHAIKDDKQQEELQSRIQDLTCQVSGIFLISSNSERRVMIMIIIFLCLAVNCMRFPYVSRNITA